MKSFSSKLSFIPSNRAIGILFYAKKNPFVAHYVLPRAWGNERPSVALVENIILVLHGLNPLRILESIGNSARFDNGTFRSGLHRMMVEWGRGDG